MRFCRCGGRNAAAASAAAAAATAAHAPWHRGMDRHRIRARCLRAARAQEHPRLSTGADVSFVVFAITFFALRLYVYPTRVLMSAVHDACGYVSCVPPAEATWQRCMHFPGYWVFVLPLVALQGLQIFWGWKVLGVIATVISGKPLEDPRED